MVKIMKLHLYVAYRSEVSGRWLKYRFVGLFDSFKAAESLRLKDMFKTIPRGNKDMVFGDDEPTLLNEENIRDI